jgi:hypothetical protein
MKTSIERAKRAFDSFASTSEKTWKSLETTSQSARVGLTALNTKIAEITRNNAEANFALALKLAESSDLAAQIIQDANPARPDVPTSRARSSSGIEQRRRVAFRGLKQLHAWRRLRPRQLGQSPSSAARRSSRDRG